MMFVFRHSKLLQSASGASCALGACHIPASGSHLERMGHTKLRVESVKAQAFRCQSLDDSLRHLSHMKHVLAAPSRTDGFDTETCI
jgi:hypothetical protein